MTADLSQDREQCHIGLTSTRRSSNYHASALLKSTWIHNRLNLVQALRSLESWLSKLRQVSNLNQILVLRLFLFWRINLYVLPIGVVLLINLIVLCSLLILNIDILALVQILILLYHEVLLYMRWFFLKSQLFILSYQFFIEAKHPQQIIIGGLNLLPLIRIEFLLAKLIAIEISDLHSPLRNGRGHVLAAVLVLRVLSLPSIHLVLCL